MTDIKPCPLCGGAVFAQPGHNGIIFVLCGQYDDGSDGCGAVFSFRGVTMFTLDEVVEKFNRRT